MLQSQLFAKTRKEIPADEVSKNAKLLIRGGFVDKLQAGVYTYLPLGLRVLKKIENIIREEMNAAGGEELLMPSLHPKENWEKTGRWDSMDDLYKVADSSGRENALGPTHEEVVVPLAKQFISSYKNLPAAVYQFQNKFRMELRAKSGILRGREFIMKDLYSFHKDGDDLKRYYDVMKTSYKTIFNRVGIGDKTYLTFASGGSFSKYSHEFQTLTPAGEDTVYVCDKCHLAINEEIISEQKTCPDCGSDNLRAEKAVEVGNIFELKTKYSKPFNLTYKDESGSERDVIMGCYGIGLGRLMGTVVEVLSDESGIIWPDSIAPFQTHLLLLADAEGKAKAEAQKLYEALTKLGVEVLYDDREDKSAGEKFADADLLGIPYRVVVSGKSLASGGIEVKRRNDTTAKMSTADEFLRLLSAKS
ncbi:MAG: aminoacyl--tRNA ligase-related protein [Candidatus Paceibacterota bacterium]|jgi:prolyl-tRNA synthetase